VIHDFAVFIVVNVLAKVEHVDGLLGDGEKVTADLDHLPIWRLPFLWRTWPVGNLRLGPNIMSVKANTGMPLSFATVS
jgi:hypothetical protein